MSPAELADYLRRLRSSAAAAAAGANPVGNENVMGTLASPAVTSTDPNDPMAVSQMLGFAKAAAPSINGSYTANVLSKLGRNTGPAQPTNPAEYDKLYDPNTYDLPQDLARRQAAMGTFDASSKLATAEAERGKTGAEVGKIGAETGRLGAEARSITEDMGGKNQMITALGRIASNPNLEADTATAVANRLLDLSGAEPLPTKPTTPKAPPEASFISGFMNFLKNGPYATDPNAPPVGGAQVQPAPTERPHVVVDPNDPTVGYYNGVKYKKAIDGGWKKLGAK
jgi:hypothetical protein